MPTNTAPAPIQETPEASTQTRSISSGPVRSIELVQLRVQHFHPHQLRDEPVDLQHTNINDFRNLNVIIHDILNAGIETDNRHADHGEGQDIAASNEASVVAVQPLAEPAMEMAGGQDEANGADEAVSERWFDCIFSTMWVFFNPFFSN